MRSPLWPMPRRVEAKLEQFETTQHELREEFMLLDNAYISGIVRRQQAKVIVEEVPKEISGDARTRRAKKTITGVTVGSIIAAIISALTSNASEIQKLWQNLHH